jgi:hypothetical protein
MCLAMLHPDKLLSRPNSIEPFPSFSGPGVSAARDHGSFIPAHLHPCVALHSAHAPFSISPFLRPWKNHSQSSAGRV